MRFKQKRVHIMTRCLFILTLFMTACGSEEMVMPPEPEDEDQPPDSPAVKVTNNITYAIANVQADDDGALDVYAPVQSGDWPVAVLLHGGSGDRKQFQYAEFSRRLAAQGVVVFTPSYSPGTPDLTISNDGRYLREVLETTICAIRYARQHADVYGGNPSHLSVIGQSAGGIFGSLASFLGEEMQNTWEAFEATRGGPPVQMTCVADSAAASVQGFVGFNGALAFFISAIPFSGHPVPARRAAYQWWAVS